MNEFLEIGGKSYQVAHSPKGATLLTGGELFLADVRDEEFPQEIHWVDGNLHLYHCAFRKLPSPLQVKGDLVVCDCPGLELPADLEVTGNLSLSDSRMRSENLPAGL